MRHKYMSYLCNNVMGKQVNSMYKVLVNLAAIQARAYNGQKQQSLASFGALGEITGEEHGTKLEPIVCKCL